MKIVNVGSKELKTTHEGIEKTSTQMKSRRASEEDGRTREMISLRSTTTIEAIKILLDKCVQNGVILDPCQNAQVIILHRKDAN